MKLSEHFTLPELIASNIASRYGWQEQFNPPEYVIENLTYLAGELEKVRKLLGHPMIISSGYRCQFLNDHLGSKRSSMHTVGLAVDFSSRFGSPLEIVKLIVNSDLKYDQVISEFYNPTNGSGWTHLSFHPESPRNQALIIDKEGVRPFEDTTT
jgi:zinc D-Ala-D-Ala carboxypeptidase